MPTVSSLFIYPIKACRGISLRQMHFDARGPVGDRRLMLVDEQGVFLSQREQPRLALIETRFDGQGRLVVAAPGAEPFTIPEAATERRKVRVWSFEAEAIDLGDVSANWFGDVLRTPCRLVRFDDDVHRATSRAHTDLEAEVAFADGYPLLLTSVESLAELNQRLERPIPMNRFRPNVVVRDCQPFEEDTWSELVADTMRLRVVKPCERCAVTTLDQATLHRGSEPLATLARFRRGAGFENVERSNATERGVTFGQNCLVLPNPGSRVPGTLSVGEALSSSPKSAVHSSGS
jgi:uncharacterized protein YcbX